MNSYITLYPRLREANAECTGMVARYLAMRHDVAPLITTSGLRFLWRYPC